MLGRAIPHERIRSELRQELTWWRLFWYEYLPAIATMQLTRTCHMRISEAVESPGEFWMPNAPDHKVSGILRISTEGRVTVDLFGRLDRSTPPREDVLVPARPPFSGAKTIGRVVGVIEEQVVTLDECIQSNSFYSFGGSVSRSTLDAKSAYLTSSHYFEDGEAAQFSSATIEYKGLQEWLSLPVWTDRTDYTGGQPQYAISATSSDPIAVHLGDGTAFSFEVSGSWSGADPAKTEITLRQNARLRITVPSPVPLSTITNHALRFQNFLSLAVNQPLPISSLVCYSPDIVEESQGEIELPIDIFGRYSNPPETQKEIRRFDLLFGHADVAESFESKLNLWWTMYDSAESAMNLYFAVTQDAYRNVEGEFLALAQAAEGFHRQFTLSEPNRPPEDFEKLLAEIQNALSEEAWTLVEGGLRHANDPTYRRRLKELIDPVKRHMGKGRERKSFVSKVVSARNRLTHQTESETDELVSIPSLVRVSSKLRALLLLQLLHQLNFSSEDIDSMVAEHIRHRLDVQLL